MALPTGTRLASFEVVDLVGAGGMGEVYRARDLRLERTVALKILPAHWADNGEMRQRFEREAQAVAALNHPNICTLHDIGRHQPTSHLDSPIDFLVMEYLQGETLAQRLEKGPLALDEALRIGIAIADALDKAHRHGVTHRDLKPANVFLVRGGSSDPPIAKLLDFGLAKLKGEIGGAGSGRASVSAVPTNPQLTAQGSIIGTLQYMAPEQLEGLEADARTDIFAFGVLLHEMISGKKTFEGKSRVLLMSAIATAEPPPISSFQPAASPALDHVVKNCLAKEPAERWQTMRDVLAELQWVAAGGADAMTVMSRSRRSSARLPMAIGVAVLLAVAATSAAIGVYLQKPVEAADSRILIPIQLTAEPNQLTNTALFDGAAFAIAPDGGSIAFSARGSQTEPYVLFRRALGAVTPARLPGTDDAAQPFWSADSQSIGFVTGGKLKRVEASGGPPQDIAPAAEIVGADWSRDGIIIFGTSKGLFRVSAQGGTPEPLTTLDSSETGHFWPHFLPDGRRFLFLAWSSQPARRAIVAGSLDDPKLRTRVMPAESKALYAEPGYLVFRRENAVYAYAFDGGRLEVSGEPKRVADGVASSGANGDGTFSVAHAGPLAYYYGSVAGGGTGAQTDGGNWQLSWVSLRNNAEQGASPGPPGPYRGVEVSPDGTRIAVHKHEGAGGDVFVVEPSGTLKQLTFNAARHNSMPIWSQPNGERIVYSSFQNNKWGLYQTLSNGSGTEEKLYESDHPLAPMSWSPDGKRLVFWVQDPKNAGDIWVLTLDDKKAEAFSATAANESHAQISADGKWIAFASNANDARTEIYVRPFPTGNGLYRISRKGGDWPRWNRNTKELIFHALGSGAFISEFFSSTVDGSGTAFEAIEPKPLLVGPVLNLPHSGGDYSTYALSPNGEQLLILQFASQVGTGAIVTTQGAEPPFGLVAAFNWTAALKK